MAVLASVLLTFGSTSLPHRSVGDDPHSLRHDWIMTFLHKLARRLAAAKVVAICFSLVILACTKGEDRDFLSPTPNTPPILAAIRLSPSVGTIRPGETIQFSATGVSNKGATVPVEVDWSASGGVITPDGVFVADRNGEYRVAALVRAQPLLTDSARVTVFTSLTDIIEVVVSPDSMELTTGDGVQFLASAQRADGSQILTPPLEWSTSGGLVDGGGWYTSTEEGEFSVLAKAEGGAEAGATVLVRGRKREIQGLLVTPEIASISVGETAQFTALGLWSDGTKTGVNGISWSSTGGSISGNGLYTAGSPGSYRVIAKYKNGVFADTVFVTVAEPSIRSLEISPPTLSLEPDAAQQYSATAVMSDGSRRGVGVSWRTTGGTITSTGLYTAPTTQGGYQVIGAVGGTEASDTSAVSVVSTAATLSSLILNPSAVSVPAGRARQFAVTGLYTDGSTKVPVVSWDASGGGISAAGLFQAGSVQGSYRVIATEPTSGKADTSTVQITAPVLDQLLLNPSTAELLPGATRQFLVSGAWSDGTTSAPEVTLTAEGGSVSPKGLYTAGSLQGTFALVAFHAPSGLADTSYITVAASAPTLTSLTVTPTSVVLPPGVAQQFSMSGLWSDGSTAKPPVDWTATGGTVTSNGLFIAGTVDGSYLVVVRHTSGLADTARVQVTTTAPTLASITLSPKNVALQTNGSRQFTASGTWSDGSTGIPTVTWSASGGTVTNGGLYVAPSTAGTYRIVARAGAGPADSTDVQVTSPPTLVALTVAPDSTYLEPGQARQFSVTGLYSSGGTGTPAVTWSATGGTVSSNGLFTAGPGAGTFLVFATSGVIVDTAKVIIGGPLVVSFQLAPDSISMFLGTSQQFTTQVVWSDGQAHAVEISYTATGGSISMNGLFTAGQVIGSFFVVASCSCGVSDTAEVSTRLSPPVLTGLVLSPQAVTSAPGGTVQYSVAGVWSDGSSSTPSVTFTAEGGAITPSGLFTAGTGSGTFPVVATDTAGGLSDTSMVTVEVLAPPPPIGGTRWPSTLTYASLNQIAPPTSSAGWQFEATHLDMAHGVDHFQGVMGADPSFPYIKYQLMETTIIGSEDAAIAAVCGAQGLDPEDAFLHYSDDTQVAAGGATFVVRGWGTGSASTRAEARVRTRIWEVERHIFNWASACARAYLSARSVNDVTVPSSGRLFTGMFIDELGDPGRVSSVPSLPPTTGGGHITEYSDRTKDAIVSSGDYRRDLGGLFRTVRMAMNAARPGSLILLNTASYTSWEAMSLGTEASGVLTEFLSIESAGYSSTGETRLWDIAKQMSDQSKLYVFVQGSKSAPTDKNFNPGNFRTVSERHEMYSLASYWMARQGLSTYYSQVPRWQQLESFWLRAQEANIGQPRNAYSVWQESSGSARDSNGQRYRVYRRDYDGAMVLFRTRYDWDDANFSSYSGAAGPFALGGCYQVLYGDKTLGPQINEISVHLAEGVVLLPCGSTP